MQVDCVPAGGGARAAVTCTNAPPVGSPHLPAYRVSCPRACAHQAAMHPTRCCFLECWLQ